jgi:hypothetical protein
MYKYIVVLVTGKKYEIRASDANKAEKLAIKLFEELYSRLEYVK